MKYTQGDRVYWVSAKMKMTVLKKHWLFQKYICVCEQGCVWKWFKPNELKPIERCYEYLGYGDY